MRSLARFDVRVVLAAAVLALVCAALAARHAPWAMAFLTLVAGWVRGYGSRDDPSFLRQASMGIPMLLWFGWLGGQPASLLLVSTFVLLLLSVSLVGAALVARQVFSRHHDFQQTVRGESIDTWPRTMFNQLDENVARAEAGFLGRSLPSAPARPSRTRL